MTSHPRRGSSGQVDVEIGGRRHQVELEHAAGGWHVTIDGQAKFVEIVTVAGRWSMLVGTSAAFALRASAAREDARHAEAGFPARQTPGGGGGTGTSYDVSVSDHGGGDLTVYVDGRAIEARVIDPRAYRRRGPGHGPSPHAGTREVVAPMPGRVVKVLVKAGDRVTRRQGLIVIEAMKMENELRAPGDAVVREVRGAEGASVEAGAVLVVLE